MRFLAWYTLERIIYCFCGSNNLICSTVVHQFTLISRISKYILTASDPFKHQTQEVLPSSGVETLSSARQSMAVTMPIIHDHHPRRLNMSGVQESVGELAKWTPAFGFSPCSLRSRANTCLSMLRSSLVFAPASLSTGRKISTPFPRSPSGRCGSHINCRFTHT